MSQDSLLRPIVRRAGGCLLRGLLILVVLIVGLAIIGAIWQSTASSAELEQFPPEGQLIDVGGYRLHLNCTGTFDGKPTVILEAGLGNFSLTWSAVQPTLAENGRVCSYDRAGLGWSDTSPMPHDAEHASVELHTLLTTAGETGPFVLVGHSLGGLYSMAYAAHYPDDVAGVVLVDTTGIVTSEEIIAAVQTELETRTDLSPEERATKEAMLANLQASGVLVIDPVLQILADAAPFGVVRLVADMLVESDTSYNLLSPELIPAYRALLLRTPYLRTTLDEMKSVETSILFVRHALDDLRGPEDASPLGEKPLLVLDSAQERPATLLDTLSDQTTLDRVDSGHYIQLEQPERVIAAVEQIVAATESLP